VTPAHETLDAPSAAERLALPRVIEPVPGAAADLAPWVARRREPLLADLRRHGALLLRGFGTVGLEPMRQVVELLAGELMEYTDRAAHRTHLAGRVYTAADYPPSHEIFLHNESTYAAHWPRKLFLHCLRPAQAGGCTPIADVRRVLARLQPSTRRAFAAKGVLYVRNFGTGLFGPSWQDAFQTGDRAEVDAYCRANGVEADWLGRDRLRTRQVRPALIRHPETREIAWFNHAAALHVTTLPERARRTVMKLFSEGDYPSNTCYGDGAPIEPDVLDEIRAAYRAEVVRFDWRLGDLLVLDNVLVAHGRDPFEGPREVVVALAEPMTWERADVVGADELDAA
jgi:alpha-ketoglutarate-dependent taurine dioxygenase